jgi:hypothetical protein
MIHHFNETTMIKHDDTQAPSGGGRLTLKEFRQAMIIVETYCEQVYKIKNNIGCWEIGAIVKLSKYGKEMQKHNKIGKVVDWCEWHSKTDGLVTVKWEGVKKPVIMHISHVELTK